jgi:glycosyltransferase involved in cell wall biosynthesis
MIYLNPEVVSGLGEDTFWMWFKREFPSASFTVPKKLTFDDVLLQYSTLGFPRIPGKTVALLWELYPEMREVFKANTWDSKIAKVFECAKFCTHRTVSSPLASKYYSEFGTVDVLPIGVNTDLFKPRKNKDALKEKYGLPPDREIGFWGGTTHPMKGYSRLLEYAKNYPDIYWIVVWKWNMEADHFQGGHNYVKISQEMMSELMNCADFILFTGLLRSYFMLEWEAMACNLPVRLFDPSFERDFIPSKKPREDVFYHKWDRVAAKILWSKYLERKGVTW